MIQRNPRSLPVVLLSLVALGAIGFSVPAYAAGTAYYVNNQPGSNCSDSGAHTIAQPWCTFTPLNKLKSFSPGDQILLAGDGLWNQQLTLTGSGSATAPITLSSYGTGDRPRIIRNQSSHDIGVLLTDPSFWNISNLEVGRASVGILLHFTSVENKGVSLSNIYVHDNKGIWSGYSTQFPVSGHKTDPFAADLNIDLSSGILFNIAPGLTFKDSQYVLKGVSLTNIRGTNNVDSIAFDNESDSTDRQDGHNAFRDVTLNGIFLSNDDGHAAPAYQAAGLGCSDSLRLMGMTGVTVLNSVLIDEAACHTDSGTAAVILGRVRNVTFVNNIIFGVPPSNSPDETGIDFEWSEFHVDLHANLFAGNAGAGVEILNIHPGDQSADIDFYDNTFANNSRTFNPGAAAVWEYCKDRGYGTPSGTIRNNFYTESTGSFFAGGNIGSVTNSENLSTSLVPSYAAEDFSPTQRKNHWRYMYEQSDSTWTNIPRFSPTDHNGAWEVNPSQFVSAFELAPATSSETANTGGVARVWVAPRTGTISIRGHVLKSDAGGGAGVYAVVNLVSGKNVTRIWPATGEKQLIAGNDQSGYATDVKSVSVAAGDQVRFEVTANGDSTHDTVSWTPSVAYTLQTPRLARASAFFGLTRLLANSQPSPAK
jgi:plastocyanin